jgi:hypothetical protein
MDLDLLIQENKGVEHMVPTMEGRREVRSVCQGDVRLYADQPEVALVAQMLDVSNNGFRAQHRYRELTPGREVRFEHQFFVGKARVVWTQEIAGKVQSGFQVLRA